MIDMIPSIGVKICDSRVLRELLEQYEALLKTHKFIDPIELIRQYIKRAIAEKNNRKFGAVDECFMKRVEDLLFGEFSASLGIPKEDVPRYISSRLNTNLSALN